MKGFGIDGNVRHRQRAHDMITVHDPMPTGATPVEFLRVMVDAVGWSFGLRGDHLSKLKSCSA